MTKKELCAMCTEHGDNGCEHEKDCKLLGILNENKLLKEKIADLKWHMSYMRGPNEIGDRHEMGG